MKSMSIFYSIFFVFVLIVSVPSHAKKPKCEGELGHLMHDSKKYFKEVREAIDLGDEESLKSAVDVLVDSLKNAKEHQPTGFKRLSAAEREQKYVAYQSALDETITLVEQLTDPSARDEALDKIKKMRKSGHKKYKRCKVDKGDHKHAH